MDKRVINGSERGDIDDPDMLNKWYFSTINNVFRLWRDANSNVSDRTKLALAEIGIEESAKVVAILLYSNGLGNKDVGYLASSFDISKEEPLYKNSTERIRTIASKIVNGKSNKGKPTFSHKDKISLISFIFELSFSKDNIKKFSEMPIDSILSTFLQPLNIPDSNVSTYLPKMNGETIAKLLENSQLALKNFKEEDKEIGLYSDLKFLKNDLYDKKKIAARLSEVKFAFNFILLMLKYINLLYVMPLLKENPLLVGSENNDVKTFIKEITSFEKDLKELIKKSQGTI